MRTHIETRPEPFKLFTIRMGRDLHKRARIRAAEEERTVSELFRDAIEEYLTKVEKKTA